MRGIPLRGDVADYPPYLELIPGLRLVRRSAATGATQVAENLGVNRHEQNTVDQISECR